MPNEAFCLPGNTSVQEILERQDDGILPMGHIYGLTLSNNGTDATNDIDIEPGCCRSTANAAHSYAQAPSRLPRHQRDLEFPDSITKQLDVVWAPGNGGGRSASSLANGTWHVFAIGGKHMKDRTFIHSSVTEANVLAAMPGGYTAYRRLGSILREGSVIVPFKQYDDYFLRKTITLITSANPGTSAVTQTIATPVGIVVEADISFGITANADIAVCYGLVTSLDATNETPTAGRSHVQATDNAIGGVAVSAISRRVYTNTSAQIRWRISTSDANTTARIDLTGWWDRRDRGA